MQLATKRELIEKASLSGRRVFSVTVKEKIADIIPPVPGEYTPYIGPYLTLIRPEISEPYRTPTVLDPATNIIINYETRAGDLSARLRRQLQGVSRREDLR